MVFRNKKKLYLGVLALFAMVNLYSQSYNKKIEAKIEIENNNEFINIRGTALNKTEVSQSARYVLSVIRTNPETGNSSKNDQIGRIVILPAEKQNLSTTTINSDETDKIIILLLLYDQDDNIIGKDKIIFNDDGKTDVKEVIDKENNRVITEKTISEEDVDNSHKDGVVLRGIVAEDTKTKPGRDFYTMFYSSYSSNKINAEQIVVIKEVMALGTNTKIEVQLDDKTIFEFFVRPNVEYLKAMTEASIRRVSYYLQRLIKQKEIINHY